MKTVYKVALEAATGITVLNLPLGAVPLSVNIQGAQEIPYLWALVDPDQSDERRTFEMVGTGDALNGSNPRFVGTIFIDSGTFVYHVFEVDPS